MKIKETTNGVLLHIFVKPNSTKFKVKLDNEEIIVYATQEPEKGKVNKEILKEMIRIFHSKVEIVSGSTSREKQLFVAGITKEQVQKILSQ